MLLADIGLSPDEMSTLLALLGDNTEVLQGYLDTLDDLPAGSFGASEAGHTLGHHSGLALDYIRNVLREMTDGLVQYRDAINGYTDAINDADANAKAAMQQLVVGMNGADSTIGADPSGTTTPAATTPTTTTTATTATTTEDGA